jgi:hypothetical protein
MTSSGLPDLSSATPILHKIRIRGALAEMSCDIVPGKAAPAGLLAGPLAALFSLNGTALSVTAVEPT